MTIFIDGSNALCLWRETWVILEKMAPEIAL
jgi:hypothetical protein